MGGGSEFVEAIYWHGGGTLAVIFFAWAVPRFLFFALDKKLGRPPMVACDPPPTPAAIADAWRQVALNWVCVVPLVMSSAPVLRRVFPADAELPSWWQLIALGIGSLVLHDVLAFIDMHTVQVVPYVFRSITTVPKILQGPMSWGGRCVHPAEMLKQAVDTFAGPALWSFLIAPLSPYAWWLWIAVIQFQWVLDRSNYALPSVASALELLGAAGQQKGGKPKKSTQAAKQGAKAVVREAAQKKTH